MAAMSKAPKLVKNPDKSSKVGEYPIFGSKSLYVITVHGLPFSLLSPESLGPDTPGNTP